MTASLDKAGSFQDRTERPWQLGFALSLTARRPGDWKFDPVAQPAKYRQWATVALPLGGKQKRILSSSEAGRSYRSMRRHLFKRYLQRSEEHTSELQSIMSTSYAV